MAILLEVGEVITNPPEGQRALKIDGDGNAVLVEPGGQSAALGGTVVADGVSVDGTGTAEDPIAVVPSYILGLTGAGWTRVDVEANAQNLDITVDGETGYVFEALCYFTCPAGTGSTYTLQPNAVSTDQEYLEIYGNQADAAAAASAANLTIGFAPATGGKSVARFTFVMKTGTVRLLFGDYINLSALNAMATYDTLGGVWVDTSTAITSLRIHSDQATGIGDGSYILWRTVGLAA